jgi:hypothetical protein
LSDEKPVGGGGARHPNSLANLPNLRGEATGGSFRPGQPPANLKHGLRSRRPGVLLGDAFAEIVGALEEAAPVRDQAGEVPVHDRLAIEAAALQLVQTRRCAAFLASHSATDERGRWRPENEGLERALGRLMGMLDRLGMTPAGRMRLGLDMVRGLSLAEQMAALADEDGEARGA